MGLIKPLYFIAKTRRERYPYCGGEFRVFEGERPSVRLSEAEGRQGLPAREAVVGGAPRGAAA